MGAESPRRVRETHQSCQWSRWPVASRATRTLLLYGLVEQPVFEDDVGDERGSQQGGLRGEEPAEPGVLVQARDDAPAEGLDVTIPHLLQDVVGDPLEGR